MTTRETSETGLRRVVRLLANVAASRGDLDGKRAAVLDGLARLVEAEFWMWKCQAVGAAISPVREAWNVVSGETFPGNGIPLENFEGGRSVLSGFRLPAETAMMSHDRIIAAQRTVEPDNRSMLALGRFPRSQPFSLQEFDLVELVFDEIPWLFAERPNPNLETRRFRIPGKPRMVLNLLLEGWGRKQIADRLHLSENTVAGYSRDLYRQFGVHSQVELMRHFSSGDGGNIQEDES